MAAELAVPGEMGNIEVRARLTPQNSAVLRPSAEASSESEVAPAETDAGATSSDDGVFTAEQLSEATRLRADWDRPPSDHPSAVLVASMSNPGAGYQMKAWKFRGEGGLDIYESQYELGLPVLVYIGMQVSTNERPDWDPHTKSVRVLEASGPARLAHLHRQAGDELTLLWCLNAPWPLPTREYMMRRKAAKLERPPASSGDVGGCYYYIDCALEERESLARAPKAKGAARVVDYEQWQLAWGVRASDGQPAVRMRIRYRDDPMLPLPKWLLSWVMEKQLPKGCAGLIKASKEYERVLAERHARTSGEGADTRDSGGRLQRYVYL